jgi:hypothetical protein
LGVDAVIARVHYQLDAVRPEEVPHGRVALLFGREAPERKLAKRDLALPREDGSTARRPVRGHRRDVESSSDQVAQVGTLP